MPSSIICEHFMLFPSIAFIFNFFSFLVGAYFRKLHAVDHLLQGAMNKVQLNDIGRSNSVFYQKSRSVGHGDRPFLH